MTDTQAEIKTTRESVDSLRAQLKAARRAQSAELSGQDADVQLARLKAEEEALKAELSAVKAGEAPEVVVPTELVSESALPEGVAPPVVNDPADAEPSTEDSNNTDDAPEGDDTTTDTPSGPRRFGR